MCVASPLCEEFILAYAIFFGVGGSRFIVQEAGKKMKEQKRLSLLCTLLLSVAVGGCADIDDEDLEPLPETVTDIEASQIDCGDSPVVIELTDEDNTTISCELPVDYTESAPDDPTLRYCLLGTRYFWFGWNAGSSVYVCLNGACGRAPFWSNRYKWGTWGYEYRSGSGTLCTN